MNKINEKKITDTAKFTVINTVLRDDDAILAIKRDVSSVLLRHLNKNIY